MDKAIGCASLTKRFESRLEEQRSDCLAVVEQATKRSAHSERFKATQLRTSHSEDARPSISAKRNPNTQNPRGSRLPRLAKRLAHLSKSLPCIQVSVLARCPSTTSRKRCTDHTTAQAVSAYLLNARSNAWTLPSRKTCERAVHLHPFVQPSILPSNGSRSRHAVLSPLATSASKSPSPHFARSEYPRYSRSESITSIGWVYASAESSFPKEGFQAQVVCNE